jgi:hypothetical protein
MSRCRHADKKGERKYRAPTHFFISALDGVSGQRHAPAALNPRWKDPPGTHWIGGWVGLRAGLDTEAREKILCLWQESNPGRQKTQNKGKDGTASALS